MRQILLTRKEPHKRTPLQRPIIANGSPQSRTSGFQRIQHRALRGWSRNLQFHLSRNPRQRPQMRRKYDPDHANVWTSTESTAGRFCTIGAQLSPASADA